MMKHKHRLLAAAAVALSLLVFLSAPCALAQQEEAAGLLSWDITVEDMLTLEDTALEDVLLVLEGDEFTQYAFLRADPEHIGVMVYVFSGEQLVMYGMNISTSMQQGPIDFNGIYAQRLAELTEIYGEPTTDDPQRAMAASNAVEADSLIAEEAAAVASWELDEDMMLYHVHRITEKEESLLTMFVHEGRLFAQ